MLGYIVITSFLLSREEAAIARLFNNATKQTGFQCLTAASVAWEKTMSLLPNILKTVKTQPDTIAISENKINENTCKNLNIPGYVFL